MLEKLLVQHINDIKQQSFKNGLLLVYKGFPYKIIENVSNSFKGINSKKDIFENGHLSLEKIYSSSKEIIKKMFNINSGIHVMTYEELLSVSNEIKLKNFDFEIIIINNNLYTEFPIDVINHFHNIDKVVENADLSYKEDDIFNYFYVYSSIKFNIPLITYKDIDQESLEKVTTINLFTDNQINLTNLDIYNQDEQKIDPKAILASDNNEKYFRFKYSILTANGINNNTIIITDPISLKYSSLEKELKILKYIFLLNNKKLHIISINTGEPKKYRKDFSDLLKKYWNSVEFRKLIFYKDPNLSNEKISISQGNLIEEIVQETEKANKNEDFRDIFITAPTGAGKSLLFQIPAIYIAQKYKLVSIIVSPLKALMYDQVDSLKNKGVNQAAFINSDISLIERENIIKKIKNGEISILYLSPELLLSYDVRQFIGERKLGLLVIDEAHLVTTWGRDFRVDYWYLGTYIKRMRKYIQNSKFPVLALTATAVYSGPDDIAFQTAESLNMRTPNLHIGNVRRNEIDFDIRAFNFSGSHEIAKIEKTKQIITDNVRARKKTIVYFPWINQIKLIKNYLDNDTKKYIGEYYGDVDKTVKQIVQDRFKKSEIIVVLATKAFGMGIDVSDIEIIYHHAPSGDLSDYIQEVGRMARKSNIKGHAIADFNERDLKFTKILYGLSSIKQYQVKLALQKINDLYEINKKRQMLISVEDFGFIFSNENEKIETKVKSALLLLEKDLELKVNNSYNVIMVRPKAMFSTVYTCIPQTIETNFIKKYGSFCKKIVSIRMNTMNYFRHAKVIDVGNIYELSLDKIWEKYFSENSFPMVKKRFFDKNLFEDFQEQPIPRYKLKVKLNKNAAETLSIIERYFQNIDKAFYKLRDISFSSEDLQNSLMEEFKNERLARRITNLITNLYSTSSDYSNIISGQTLSRDTFIQTKRDERTGLEKFKLISSKYMRIKPLIMQKFQSMFNKDDTLFEKFIATTETENEYKIKIAYLIESFSLGTYEVLGGQLSQIYIRINEPYKLKLFAIDENYSNKIIQDIEKRHERSIQTMSYFFSTKMNNNQRWIYIEDYFLGKTVQTTNNDFITDD